MCENGIFDRVNIVIIQWTRNPLYEIILGQSQSDNINRIKAISDLQLIQSS
jgi:hypothetical protein